MIPVKSKLTTRLVADVLNLSERDSLIIIMQGFQQFVTSQTISIASYTPSLSTAADFHCIVADEWKTRSTSTLQALKRSRGKLKKAQVALERVEACLNSLSLLCSFGAFSEESEFIRSIRSAVYDLVCEFRLTLLSLPPRSALVALKSTELWRLFAISETDRTLDASKLAVCTANVESLFDKIIT